jgi:hypothetical protein
MLAIEAVPYLHILHEHILGLEPLGVCNEHRQLAVPAQKSSSQQGTVMAAATYRLSARHN